jgi:hypothetical protein
LQRKPWARSTWMMLKGHVTPSVLHCKSTAKTHHEHHIYMWLHMLECFGKVSQLKMINEMLIGKLSYVSHNYQVSL